MELHPSPAGNGQDPRHARLLLITTEPNFGRTLRRVLERCGYSVEAAGGGEEALERLGRERFDGVVSQVHLPGDVCGVTLLQRLREGGHEVPVLLLTDHETKRIREAAESTTSCTCVNRHANLDFLKSTLAACLFPVQPRRHL